MGTIQKRPGIGLAVDMRLERQLIKRNSVGSGVASRWPRGKWEPCRDIPVRCVGFSGIGIGYWRDNL